MVKTITTHLIGDAEWSISGWSGICGCLLTTLAILQTSAIDRHKTLFTVDRCLISLVRGSIRLDKGWRGSGVLGRLVIVDVGFTDTLDDILIEEDILGTSEKILTLDDICGLSSFGTVLCGEAVDLLVPTVIDAGVLVDGEAVHDTVTLAGIAV
jgi:hypothetical protein